MSVRLPQGLFVALAPPALLVPAAMLCGPAARALPPEILHLAPSTYLPIHTAMEILSIAVSLMVFSLGWVIHDGVRGRRALILGLAAAAAGLLDFLHTLSYPGMPDLVTPSSTEKGINLWLMARLALAIGLLGACIDRGGRADRRTRWISLAVTACVTLPAGILGVARPGWFPDTFEAGIGLTPFKVGAEWVLASVYVVAASLLLRRAAADSDANEAKLAAAAWLLALTEVMLTLYAAAGDVINLSGHGLKALAYMLIYDSLFVSGVKAPNLALAQERALLRTLMDAVPDLIFFKDTESRYLGYNKAFAAYCGRPETEMLGKTDFEFTSSEVAEFYRAKDRDAMAAGHPTGNEEWIDYPDGHRVLLDTVKAPILGEDGRLLGLVGISRDITGRKRAEEELRRAHADLEMVTGITAHDLQEPARTIASFLQLLQLRYGDRLDGEAGQYITYAVEGSRRMRAQLAALLEYTQIDHDHGDPVAVECDIALAEALDSLRERVVEADAVVRCATPMPVVLGRPSQIRALFLHLIGNAVKFRSADRPPEVAITAEQDDGVWIFRVHDNGIGIEPTYWDKIFQVFQRLHPLDRYDGTGIGLAICKKIVERHGGTIRVDSVPSEGSTFTFTLPVRS